MCGSNFSISTNNTDVDSEIIDVNTAAAEGIMSIGGGYYNLEEFLSSIEVPSMSSKMYYKHHEKVCNG